jgi:hypothetical protein
LNRLILAASITAAIALPSIAIAQGAAAPRTTLRIPVAGTVVCRPIKTGETGNATMGTVQLRCRNVNVSRIRTAMTAIHTEMSSMSMTPAQMTTMQSSINALNEELEPSIPGGAGEN